MGTCKSVEGSDSRDCARLSVTSTKLCAQHGQPRLEGGEPGAEALYNFSWEGCNSYPQGALGLLREFTRGLTSDFKDDNLAGVWRTNRRGDPSGRGNS